MELTPEVQIREDVNYIVRINSEIVGSVFDEETAVLVIDSLVAHEIRRLSNDWVKVLREDLKEGKRVILSTQTIGRLYNGAIVKIMEFDCVPVPNLDLIKSRQSFPTTSLPIPIPPPPPSRKLIDGLYNKITSVPDVLLESDY